MYNINYYDKESDSQKDGYCEFFRIGETFSFQIYEETNEILVEKPIIDVSASKKSFFLSVKGLYEKEDGSKVLKETIIWNNLCIK